MAQLVLAATIGLRKLASLQRAPSMETFSHVLRGLLGIAAFVGLATLLSDNRKAIAWRVVVMGLALQIAFAALVIYFGPVRALVEWVGARFVDLLGFTNEGSKFVFGSLADQGKHGVVFAIGILPSIIFFSAFSSMLYYLGILQKVVYAFAWVMSRTMRLSGAETLSASANIFLGQTEAPLLIKPYLAAMTRSEILCIMTGGMATIAGAVMIAYISFLGGSDPGEQVRFATHLITASVISAPAALMTAKILVPQTEPVDRSLEISREKIGTNLLDAICLGTTDGLRLALNVGAMLIVFTALVAMTNAMLGWIGHPHTFAVGGRTLFDYPGIDRWIESATGGTFKSLSLEFVLGLLYAPIAWLIGIDNRDLMVSGSLLGTRTVLNEFVAYLQMGQMKSAGVYANPRNLVIMTYALCGFANIVSIGIQVGGIGALAPNQRGNLAKLGVKAMVGGTIACLLTACVAGMLIG
jgi:CNT family concentrative nucleoside transporter